MHALGDSCMRLLVAICGFLCAASVYRQDVWLPRAVDRVVVAGFVWLPLNHKQSPSS